MRKKLEKMILIVFLFWAENAFAAGYEPLVQIPGLPQGGVIDISAYLVGIYNFALSIVGIVAVIMLIIGGMKYITAVGNSGKVSDAKDTIWSAILGLLLAILSYVIVSTLNPDILYLRQPGAEFVDILNSTPAAPECGQSYNAGVCTCKDGYHSQKNVADMNECNTECFAENRCLETHACIAPGSPINSADPGYSVIDGCTCGDGTRLTLPEGSDCTITCANAKRCGNKFLVIRLAARNGYLGDGYYHLATDGEHEDQIWDFTLTNDGDYANFDIPSTVTSYPGHPDFNCAILVTNVDRTLTRFDLNENWVYWVKDGTRITREGKSIYDQINGLAYDGCRDDACGQACAMDWALWGGECDKGSVERIIKAQWGDDIANKCDDCNFAEWDGDKPAYRPAYNIKCVHGYWQ